MNDFIPDILLKLLSISVVFSAILMAIIQKFKTLTIIKKDWQVWLLNLIFSFLLGIPFAIIFYNLTLINSIWIGIFSFIGAPTIYDLLKQQNLINYTPKSLNNVNRNTVTISTDNEIKRS